MICAKVARYAERIHHPDRLLHPLVRTGPKGSGQFAPISWDDALDLVAEKFLAAEAQHGSEAVWPYYYAGTMGLVMRDGINRLRHVKKYSGFHSTICVNPAWTGFIAGTGKLAGPDPREMAKSDLRGDLGHQSGQHAGQRDDPRDPRAQGARRQDRRGRHLQNGTMEQADLAVLVRPGTDGALACAVMHCLFRDGFADRDYLEKYTDAPRELEAHVRTRSPAMGRRRSPAARSRPSRHSRALVGERKRAYFRLGYGFARSRNGTANMHAASCIAAVRGSWALEGGGAFHNNGAIYHWNKTHDRRARRARSDDPHARPVAHRRRSCAASPTRWSTGTPVTALLIQNTNPVSVAPEQDKVKRGFAREDLFVCVHEQFMTETALMADVVLPATMFMEHDDIYQGGGHQYIQLGPKLIDPPGECRSNHEVICALAQAPRRASTGLRHDAARADRPTCCSNSGWGTLAELEAKQVDRLPAGLRHRALHQGLRLAGRQIPLQAGLDDRAVPLALARRAGRRHAGAARPLGGDRGGDGGIPFRLGDLAGAQFPQLDLQRDADLDRAREAPDRDDPSGGCRARSASPTATRSCSATRAARCACTRSMFDGVRRGVLIAESIWPNKAYEDGKGINTLTGADAIAPYGGAAFHDNRVWVRGAAAS